MNTEGTPTGPAAGNTANTSPGPAAFFDWAWALNRVRDVLLKPAETWRVIKSEPHSIPDVYKKYFLVLAAIPAICSFIGMLFLKAPFFWMLFVAVLQYLMVLAFVFIMALVVEFLAPKFDGSSTREEAFKLLAYSYTPLAVAGIFSLLPFLGIVRLLISLLLLVYSLYILYLGVPELARVPEDKRPVFTVAVVVAGVVVLIALGVLMFIFGFGAVVGMH